MQRRHAMLLETRTAAVRGHMSIIRRASYR